MTLWISVSAELVENGEDRRRKVTSVLHKPLGKRSAANVRA